MIKIRKGVFETNSSSVHAISVMPMDFADSYSKYEFGDYVNDPDRGYPADKLIFKPIDFGWEFALLDRPSEKAAYFAALAAISACHAVSDDLFDSARKRAKVIRNEYGKIIEKVSKYLNSENINYGFAGLKFDCYGYLKEGRIDHGEDALAAFDYIVSSKEAFFGFIFDNQSLVWTGNDNGTVIPWLKANQFYPADRVVIFEKGN